MNNKKFNIKMDDKESSIFAGIKTWKTMFYQLWDSRNIIEQLVKRDISVRYRQSFLGYLWAIIVPVFIVIAFTYLTSRRVLPIGDVPFAYPAFAIWNLVIWQLFSNILVACSQSLSNAGALTTKVNFAKETLVLSSLGQPLFDFFVKLPLVLCVFIFFDVNLSGNIMFTIIFLVLIILLATGIGFILAIVNLVFRDTENVIGIAATYGMFLAPVLYPPPNNLPFSLVNIINPFSPLLIAIQELIATGRVVPDIFLIASIIISFVTFLIGWRIFYMVLPVVIERA